MKKVKILSVIGVAALGVVLCGITTFAQTPESGAKDEKQNSSTIKDSRSGKAAIVDSTRKILTLRSQDGKALWSTNVVDAVKGHVNGAAQIRHVQFGSHGTNLLVTVGKHSSVNVDIQNGKCTFLGSD
jgi:hypothetical protein